MDNIVKLVGKKQAEIFYGSYALFTALDAFASLHLKDTNVSEFTYMTVPESFLTDGFLNRSVKGAGLNIVYYKGKNEKNMHVFEGEDKTIKNTSDKFPTIFKHAFIINPFSKLEDHVDICIYLNKTRVTASDVKAEEYADNIANVVVNKTLHQCLFKPEKREKVKEKFEKKIVTKNPRIIFNITEKAASKVILIRKNENLYGGIYFKNPDAPSKSILISFGMIKPTTNIQNHIFIETFFTESIPLFAGMLFDTIRSFSNKHDKKFSVIDSICKDLASNPQSVALACAAASLERPEV